MKAKRVRKLERRVAALEAFALVLIEERERAEEAEANEVPPIATAAATVNLDMAPGAGIVEDVALHGPPSTPLWDDECVHVPSYTPHGYL